MIRFRTFVACMATLVTAGCLVQSVPEPKQLVINVLDKSLYNDCHIPGSIQVDFDKVEAYVSKSPKDLSIIVYCSNYACMTSHFVVKRLRDKGYINARVYSGGMAEWFQAGYLVDGPSQSAYLHKEVLPNEEDSDELPKISIKELAELLKIV